LVTYFLGDFKLSVFEATLKIITFKFPTNAVASTTEIPLSKFNRNHKKHSKHHQLNASLSVVILTKQQSIELQTLFDTPKPAKN
jgi:hypothetical protein